MRVQASNDWGISEHVHFGNDSGMHLLHHCASFLVGPTSYDLDEHTLSISDSMCISVRDRFEMRVLLEYLHFGFVLLQLYSWDWIRWMPSP